jgi:hypothetical protein
MQAMTSSDGQTRLETSRLNTFAYISIIQHIAASIVIRVGFTICVLIQTFGACQSSVTLVAVRLGTTLERRCGMKQTRIANSIGSVAEAFKRCGIDPLVWHRRVFDSRKRLQRDTGRATSRTGIVARAAQSVVAKLQRLATNARNAMAT